MTNVAVNNRLRAAGKRMLAVLSEVGMRPLLRWPESGEGDGGGKAPGE